MKKAVFFGSIELAKECLEEIVMKQDIELLGVCCTQLTKTWRKEKSVYEFCIENNIPILSFNEIQKLSPDVGFSVRYDKIIPQIVIDSFNYGIFNTHGGILPEYRGSYSNINTLINNGDEFGVTLHYISQKLDEGDIVAIKKVKVEKSDTGFNLYKKGEQLCYEILNENIRAILNNTNHRVSQKKLINLGHPCKTYYAESTLEKKLINRSEINNSLNIIRAFDSPHHEPAYTLVRGQKVYLRMTYD